MKLRWKYVLAAFIPLALLATFPYWYGWINPDSLATVRCVRKYPDGRIEKDAGDSCYDPELPEAIVIELRQ